MTTTLAPTTNQGGYRARPGQVQAYLLRSAKAPPHPGCSPWPFNLVNGYPTALNKRTGQSQLAVKVLWELRNGREWPSDLECRHLCGRSWCMNADHVEPSDHATNMADQLRHGTTSKGERQGQARLNDDLVVSLCHRIAAGEQQKAVAEDLGVSETTVSVVWNNKAWTHLDPSRFPVGCPRRPLDAKTMKPPVTPRS